MSISFGRALKRVFFVTLTFLSVSNSSLAAVSCASSSAVRINSLPYIITQAGTYCLAGSMYINQSGNNSAWSAVTIAASDVTLDLNRWAINGPGAYGSNPSVSGYGVTVTNYAQNVTVRNGTLSGFLEGVSAWTNSGSNDVSGLVVEDMQIWAMGSAGVHVGFNSNCNGCIIRKNSISNINANYCTTCGGWSGAYGIRMERSNNLTVSNNIITGVHSRGDLASSGIYLYSGSNALVSDNIVSDTADSATPDTGILGFSYSNMTVNNNRINYFYRGIWYAYSTGTYSGNTINQVTVPYKGGTAN